MTTILIVGCSHLGNESPKESERPTDICTANINSFKYSIEELKVLTRRNKENALQVNCTLYHACGFDVPNSEVCEQIN